MLKVQVMWHVSPQERVIKSGAFAEGFKEEVASKLSLVE